MSKIADLLAGRSDTVWSVTSDQSVLDAIKLMADKNIGAVCVIDDGNLTGIFSERDFVRKMVVQNRSAEQTSMADVMTRDVISVSREDNLERCLKLMSEHSFRHLPVTEGERVVSMISTTDIVKAIIKEQQFTIEQLESYIAG